MKLSAILACVSALALGSYGQKSDSAVLASMSAGEREVIQSAPSQERLERRHLVLYLEKGTLPAHEAQAFADEQEKIFEAVSQTFHCNFDAQQSGLSKAEYYPTERAGISHLSKGRIFLKTTRVLAVPSISVHETTHLVLSAPNSRAAELSSEQEKRMVAQSGIWLFEGLANYTACVLAPKLGLPNKYLFIRGDNTTIDQEAKEWIADKRGASVLPYVGPHGIPENLVSDRANVAQPFYLLSQSFVKYMVEQVGMDAAAALYTEQDKNRGVIETEFLRITGKELSDVRTRWLQHLGKS